MDPRKEERAVTAHDDGWLRADEKAASTERGLRTEPNSSRESSRFRRLREAFQRFDPAGAGA